MTSRPRVLVLDDDESIRNSLCLFLEDCDFDISPASNAEQALQILEGNPHDVALVDIRLPEIDGETFILRAYQIDPKLVFLIYTGSVHYRVSSALEEIGVDAKRVFLKPLPDLNALADKIHELTSAMSLP